MSLPANIKPMPPTPMGEQAFVAYIIPSADFEHRLFKRKEYQHVRTFEELQYLQANPSKCKGSALIIDVPEITNCDIENVGLEVGRLLNTILRHYKRPARIALVTTMFDIDLPFYAANRQSTHQIRPYLFGGAAKFIYDAAVLGANDEYYVIRKGHNVIDDEHMRSYSTLNKQTELLKLFNYGV